MWCGILQECAGNLLNLNFLQFFVNRKFTIFHSVIHLTRLFLDLFIAGLGTRLIAPMLRLASGVI